MSAHQGATDQTLFGFYHFQQRSAARAEAEGDDEDDLKAQEDQEFLETLQDSKERNSGNKHFVLIFLFVEVLFTEHFVPNITSPIGDLL